MDSETIKLILDLQDSSRNAEDFRKKVEKLGEAFEKVEPAAAKAEKSTANFGRAGLEAGRIIQDFAQGGIGGILNNFEGLTMALGGTAGLAGLITGVGVAAYVAFPLVRNFVKAVVDGANDIPKSVDALDRLNDALKANKDRLNELKDQGKLTNTELAEYNGLLAARVDLEKQVTTEKNNQAEAAKLAKLQAFGEQDAEQDRAKNLQAGVGGDQGALVDQVAAGITKDSKELQDAQAKLRGIVKEYNNAVQVFDPKAMEAKFKPIIAAQEQKIGDIRAGIGAEATNAVSGAVLGGKEADLRRVLQTIPKGSKFRNDLESALPGADTGDADLAASDAFADRARAGSRQRAARKKQDAALNADGLANENLWRKQMADDAKTEAKDAAKSKADEAKLTAMLNAAGQPGEDAMRKEVAGNARADARSAQVTDIAHRLDNETGGNLNEQQLMTAAESTQKLIEKGHSPLDAAGSVMEGIAQANIAMMGRMGQTEAGLLELAERFRWQAAQNRQQAQTMNSQMGRAE